MTGTFPTHKSRRLSREGRLSVLELAVLGLTLAAIVATASLSSRNHIAPDLETVSVRVDPGDTLWSIAASHPIDGLDTAQATEYIARLNSLPDSTLVAGRTLRVPVGAVSSEFAMR